MQNSKVIISNGGGYIILTGFQKTAYTAIGGRVKDTSNTPKWVKTFMEKVGYTFSKNGNIAIHEKGLYTLGNKAIQELGFKVSVLDGFSTESGESEIRLNKGRLILAINNSGGFFSKEKQSNNIAAFIVEKYTTPILSQPAL